jgi:putative ABC transport system substrate-binding protein
MRRRAFITLLSGAVAWPLAARSQDRMRRVGVLMNATAEQPEAQSYLTAFQQGMQEFGWSVGRNLRVDLRWGSGDADLTRRYAAELAALSPDVMLAAGGPVVSAMQRASRTVPIVFAQSIDPVGSGIVASLARPGGNVTGFTQFEYGLSGKWAELLKEIAPGTRRVGVMSDPANPAGIGQWAIIQAAAATKGMEVIPLAVVNPSEIEPGIAGFARDSDGGLVVPVSASAIQHREAIIAGAARHRLPAVYCYRHFVVAGGLISYGPDLLNQYRRAALYRPILKGEWRRRPASASADQVRSGNQPQDCQSAWARPPRYCARAR